MWGVCRSDECELNSEDGLASWGVTSARNEHERLHGQKRLPAAHQRVMHLTCLEIAVLFHSRRQRSFSRLALEASQPVCPVQRILCFSGELISGFEGAGNTFLLISTLSNCVTGVQGPGNQAPPPTLSWF